MTKRVKLNIETGCHEISKSGKTEYPTLKVGNSLVAAHRLAYLLYVGPIPKGRLVLHKCDNNKCINPAHLYIGTHKDNVNDMLNPGRWGVKSIKTVGIYKSAEREPIIRNGTIQHRPPLKAPQTASALSPGQDHSTAKLTEDQVREIRASSKPGRILAEQYGVAPGTISKIRNRYLWRHLA